MAFGVNKIKENNHGLSDRSAWKRMVERTIDGGTSPEIDSILSVDK